MYSTRQDNGTYATTPVHIGMGAIKSPVVCAHKWETQGTKEVLVRELIVSMELQHCTLCGTAYRSVYGCTDQDAFDQFMEAYRV